MKPLPRAYIEQVWAEAMTTYKSGDFKLSFTPEMIQYLKEHQRDFMPEDTKAGMIQAYLTATPAAPYAPSSFSRKP